MRQSIPLLPARHRGCSARVPVAAKRRAASARRRRALIPAAVLLFQAAFIGADPVTETQVRRMAEGWLCAGHAALELPPAVAVLSVTPWDDLGFVVALNPAGFLMAPADDCLEPVLACAAAGQFNFTPDYPLAVMARRDLRARRLRMAESGTAALRTAAERAKRKWQYLLQWSAQPVRAQAAQIADQRVPPLLQSACRIRNGKAPSCATIILPRTIIPAAAWPRPWRS